MNYSSLPKCIINENPDMCECPLKSRNLCNQTFMVFNDLRKRYRTYKNFNEDDIEDILSMTFKSILENVDRLQSLDKYKNWVYKIAENKRIDFYKKNFFIGYSGEAESKNGNTINIKNIKVPLDELINRIEEVYEEDSSKESLESILEFLNNYEPNDRSNCITLYLELLFYENEGMQLKDLAQSCCLKPNTLTKKLSRCREIVKKILIKEGFVWS